MSEEVIEQDDAFSPATNALLGASNGVGVQIIHDKIARRILELEDEFRALQNRYNVASPISRLPLETLADIFLALHAVCSGSSYKRRQWVQITFVCKLWRSIALDCTSLWSDLPIINPTFTDAVLSRSNGAPISLKLSSFRP
ncbi:hypothetical protein FA13DRAFT_1689134, partial [Coprinellus micaceus]